MLVGVEANGKRRPYCMGLELDSVRICICSKKSRCHFRLRFLVLAQLLYVMHSRQPCADQFAQIGHAQTHELPAASILRLRGSGADGKRTSRGKGMALGETAGEIEKLFEKRERLSLRRLDNSRACSRRMHRMRPRMG